MAIIRPFEAIRPAAAFANQVISLPYDVMNRSEAAEMASGNPYSFLHVCRSEIDLPECNDPYSEEVYKKAKQNISELLTKKILLREEKPMFYIYRQTMDGRMQTGLVACVSVDDYQNNIIKKHEFTRIEKELDRIRHFDICNANTEPVFLTYRRKTAIDEVIQEWTQIHNPEYDFLTKDGIGHILWKIDEEATLRFLMEQFNQIPSLYIADGHHRSASAVKVGLKRREESPNFTGEEEFNFYMAVIFPDEDLKIYDYNRVIKDLNGYSKEQFLKKLSFHFEVTPAQETPYVPDEKHTFSMFLDNVWYKLAAKNSILSEDIIEGLDVSILQNNVLDPLLGIKDPRTDKRIDFVGGIRGLKELERRCQTDMQIAFALYPVSISDLLSVSDEGKVMPPKSTWFEPKLGSGLFMHEL
ncbi:DUF1015 domain-containing protein [Sinanaerobacter sp. ZZT-01]|uniref:DUF1015 domain-containing protein n=1 Tax=Sinanaerobacter sp. ZZT-01 TaxID=3111540 RepID=UPI002D772686|nr:DUF1015 family protein [Sinanaerobacter sp. ZZT-01]WRR92607.1 DUF1015 family protein [Sinanaerobacter sp. ZZT-01]